MDELENMARWIIKGIQEGETDLKHNTFSLNSVNQSTKIDF